MGLAVDVGSTTIAAHLTDLSTGEVVASAGLMNPQIRFGEDLMSRVSYVMMNPGGEKEMTTAIRVALQQPRGEEVAKQASFRSRTFMEVTCSWAIRSCITSSSGIDPTELGGAPFALTTGLPLTFPAREMEFKLNAGAYVYVLPCIAGHVGADAAGVVLSEAPHSRTNTCSALTWAPMPKSCWATKRAAARLLLAHGPGL